MMMPETLEMEALPQALEVQQKVEREKTFWQKHHGTFKQVGKLSITINLYATVWWTVDF